MNHKDKNKQLLEAFILKTINEALKEQEVFDYTDSSLYKAFFQPFTDILQTAQHATEKILATAGGEAKMLAKGVAFTLIPFFKPDGGIGAMFERDREKLRGKLGHIDAKFKDVLDRNWQTMNTLDVWGTLFLMQPQLAIGVKLASKAPEVALELLSTLTGGSPAVEAILQGYKNLKTGGGRVNVQGYSGGSSGGGGDYGGGYGYDDYGGDYGDYGGMYEGIADRQSVVPGTTFKTKHQFLLLYPSFELAAKAATAYKELVELGLFRSPDAARSIPNPSEASGAPQAIIGWWAHYLDVGHDTIHYSRPHDTLTFISTFRHGGIGILKVTHESKVWWIINDPNLKLYRTSPIVGEQQQQQQRQQSTSKAPPVDANKWATAQIQTLLKNPEIRQKIAASPITRAMQAEAVNMVVSAAKKDLGRITPASIKQKAGSKFHEAMMKFQEKLPEDQKNLDLENDPAFQASVVKDIKNALKPAYIAQLKTLLQSNPAASSIVNAAIQQIQAL